MLPHRPSWSSRAGLGGVPAGRHPLASLDLFLHGSTFTLVELCASILLEPGLLLPTPKDRPDGPCVVDVVQRILVEQHHVRPLADFERADLVQHAEHLSRVARCHGDELGGREADRQQLQFFVQAQAREDEVVSRVGADNEIEALRVELPQVLDLWGHDALKCRIVNAIQVTQ